MAEETKVDTSTKESALGSQVYFTLSMGIAVFLGIAFGTGSQIIIPNFWNSATVILCSVVMGFLIGVLFACVTLNSVWTGALIGFPLSFGLVVARGGLPGFVFGFCFLLGLILGFVPSYGFRWLAKRHRKAEALASKPISMTVGRPTC